MALFWDNCKKVKIEVTGPKKAQMFEHFQINLPKTVELRLDVVLEVFMVVGSKFIFTKFVDTEIPLEYSL